MNPVPADPCRLKLHALTAAELMAPNPISIRHDASIYDAVVLMTDRRINAAPVINDAGRPVGVISVSDILIHDREFADSCADRAQRTAGVGGGVALERPVTDATTVSDIMTPAIITVDLATPAALVVDKMLGMKLHHLFVADGMGTVAGVISALDVLRRLHGE